MMEKGGRSGDGPILRAGTYSQMQCLYGLAVGGEKHGKVPQRRLEVCLAYLIVLRVRAPLLLVIGHVRLFQEDVIQSSIDDNVGAASVFVSAKVHFSTAVPKILRARERSDVSVHALTLVYETTALATRDEHGQLLQEVRVLWGNRPFTFSIAAVVTDKGGIGSCASPPAVMSFCLGKRWASDSGTWRLWRDTSLRSDDRAADMSGFGICSWDEER